MYAIRSYYVPFFGAAQGIDFESGSFQQALNKAKNEKKVLFIDGYADWCAPCKKMAKTVFKEESVGEYFNEHFVSYKLDIEKGNGPKLKEKYGIIGLPGYVFIDGNDEVVYRFSDAMPTDEFINEAKIAVASANDPNSLGRLSELYNKNKEDEALFDGGAFYRRKQWTEVRIVEVELGNQVIREIQFIFFVT